MAFNQTFTVSQNCSEFLDESSIDKASNFRSLRTSSTLLEDLFLSLRKSYSWTDVALVLPDGCVIKVHKFTLCLSEVMGQRIGDAEQSEPRPMYDDRHLRIDLPETLQLCPTVQVIFLLYIGRTVYSNGKPMKDALTWFGIRKVMRIPFEGQEFFEDYKSELMREFENFYVPYTKDGMDYLMNVEGNNPPPKSTPIQLYCSQCGLVFSTGEEIDNHHLDSKCPKLVPLNFVSKNKPVLECNKCGSLFTRILRKNWTNKNLTGASPIPGFAHSAAYFETIGETLCQLCLPVEASPIDEISSTPNSYGPRYCFDCLLIIATEQDERDHDVECAITHGKGPVGNLRFHQCKIQNCGMMFVEAHAPNEGIYQHTEFVHKLIKDKAYAFLPDPICLVCNINERTLYHCSETVEDFLRNVFECYEAKEKKIKRKPPLKTRFLNDVTIERDLDSSKWYHRLVIHRNEPPSTSKEKDNQVENVKKNPQATGSRSKQPGQPSQNKPVQECVGRRRNKPVTAASNQPVAANQKRKFNQEGVEPGEIAGPAAKKGTGSSNKKKQTKKC